MGCRPADSGRRGGAWRINPPDLRFPGVGIRLCARVLFGGIYLIRAGIFTLPGKAGVGEAVLIYIKRRRVFPIVFQNTLGEGRRPPSCAAASFRRVQGGVWKPENAVRRCAFIIWKILRQDIRGKRKGPSGLLPKR
jgi:hypothetical protein